MTVTFFISLRPVFGVKKQTGREQINISFYFTPIDLTTSISGFPSDEHHSDIWRDGGCTPSGKSSSSGRGRFLYLRLCLPLHSESPEWSRITCWLPDAAGRLTLHFVGGLGWRHVLKSQNGLSLKNFIPSPTFGQSPNCTYSTPVHQKTKTKTKTKNQNKIIPCRPYQFIVNTLPASHS